MNSSSQHPRFIWGVCNCDPKIGSWLWSTIVVVVVKYVNLRPQVCCFGIYNQTITHDSWDILAYLVIIFDIRSYQVIVLIPIRCNLTIHSPVSCRLTDPVHRSITKSCPDRHPTHYRVCCFVEYYQFPPRTQSCQKHRYPQTNSALISFIQWIS